MDEICNSTAWKNKFSLWMYLAPYDTISVHEFKKIEVLKISSCVLETETSY
jgi:hypothetical protein